MAEDLEKICAALFVPAVEDTHEEVEPEKTDEEIDWYNHAELTHRGSVPPIGEEDYDDDYDEDEWEYQQEYDEWANEMEYVENSDELRDAIDELQSVIDDLYIGDDEHRYWPEARARIESQISEIRRLSIELYREAEDYRSNPENW